MVMLGRTSNGRLEWKTAGGRSLKELQEDATESPAKHRGDPTLWRPSQRLNSTSPSGGILRIPRSGAGGNRTPVHQPVNELATTIPGVATDAVTPTGRLSAQGGPRSVFPERQQSFPLAVVFPTVIPHFCCRAVMEWPRATFLLTMTLHSSDRNQAARANCSSAILVVSPFYESEKLGSQTRTALLTSKPVSPVFDMCSHRIRRLMVSGYLAGRAYRRHGSEWAARVRTPRRNASRRLTNVTVIAMTLAISESTAATSTSTA
jgi:hypothetical protein